MPAGAVGKGLGKDDWGTKRKLMVAVHPAILIWPSGLALFVCIFIYFGATPSGAQDLLLDLLTRMLGFKPSLVINFGTPSTFLMHVSGY